MLLIILLALAGLALSIYVVIVEQKLKKDAQYKAVCDLSDKMSCTKPILSKYGKLFGISNGVLGILFYSALIILAILQLKFLVFIAAIGACIGSLGFAWILYTKIKTFCLICSSIYLINILLLIVSYFNL